MPPPRLGFPLLFVLVWLGRLIGAAIVKRIIDDAYGEEVTGDKPIYSPPQAWRSNCVSCAFGDRYGNPETYAHNKTWSTSTYIPGADPPTIEISFIGSVISVYFVVFNFPPTSPQFPTQTIVNLTVDGVPPIFYFRHTPDPNKAAVLTQPVNLVGFSNDQHKLLISASGPEAVLIDFDYATYEYDNSLPLSQSSSPSPSPSISPSISPSSSSSSESGSAPSSSGSTISSSSSESARPSPTDGPATTTTQGKNNIGLIAGAVAGGVAATLIVVAAVYCCQRRRLARGESNFSIDDEGPAMAAQHGPIIPFIDGTGVNAPGRGSVGIQSVLRTPHLDSPHIFPPLASPYGSPSVYMSGYSVNEERHSSIPRGLNRTNGVPDRTSQYASGTSSSAYAASYSASPLSVPSSSSAGKAERQLLVANQDVNDLNEDGRGGLGRVIPQTEAEMLEMRRQMQLMKMQIDSLQLKQLSERAGPSDELPPPEYEPAEYDSTLPRSRGKN